MHVINLTDFRVTPWFNPCDEKLPNNLKEVPSDLYAKYVAGDIKDEKALLNAIIMAESGAVETPRRGRKPVED